MGNIFLCINFFVFPYILLLPIICIFTFQSNHYNVNETVTDSWQGLSANGNYSYGGNTQYNSYGNNEDNDDNWSEDWDDGQSEATTIEPVNDLD